MGDHAPGMTPEHHERQETMIDFAFGIRAGVAALDEFVQAVESEAAALLDDEDFESDDPERARCDVCGQLFTPEEWEDRHQPHDPDCPNYDRDDTADENGDSAELVDCDCPCWPVHDRCCPSCNPEQPTI